MSEFDRIAENNNWSLTTQVAVLLDYIENQQSTEAFDDYLAEVPANAGSVVADVPEEPLSNANNIFRCVIGVFEEIKDVHPTADYNVYVNARNEADALESSLALCKESYAKFHVGKTFSTIARPLIVDLIIDDD